MTFAVVLDIGQLAQVIEASLIAGIGVSIAFSLVIRGTVRATEQRQTHPLAAGLHALMAVIGLLFCLAAIVFGVSVMLSK